MRVHFLGGADEIGASCTLVEVAGLRVLVDAGVRMGASSRDRLPDLARATEAGGLDVVLLTHAHLDHSGALPLVLGAFPGAQVLMTEPTLALIRILLLDALHIMEQKAGQEGELPLYPLPLVEALLGQSRAAPLLVPVPLDREEKVRATFFPAGHILGAVAVGLESPEGNLLISGDVSVDDQLTVPGMVRPRFQPDLVLAESTYGDRLHASRRAEEQRLVGAVQEALSAGGKVLIPAFALGRAQEVLLVLRRALANGSLPAQCVVYADGMVRSICNVYQQFAPFLTPALRQRAGRGAGLFYTADGRVQPVGSPEQRQQIVDGPPCVIVSSSGMLSGGPSTWYASRLAPRPDALIAITGYQDEEAPGRQLQELASGKSGELRLDGSSVPVACRVGSFGLSAHADAQQLASLVDSLGPRQVALVHGEGRAREGLAHMLGTYGVTEVLLPSAGDTLELSPGRSRRPRPAVVGMGCGRPLDQETLTEMHGRLQAGPRARGSFTVRELAELWHGSAAVPVDLAPLGELLACATGLFAPDRKRPYLYRLAGTPGADCPVETPQDTKAGPMEQNAALALTEQILGPATGLYRRGAERDAWRLRLYFDFPDVAVRCHAEALEELAARTGWAVQVHPEPRQAALEQRVRELLQSVANPLRAPSILHEERRVRLAVSSLPPPEVQRSLSEALEQATGFALELQPATSSPPQARTLYDEQGRMEVNAALALLDEAFAGQRHRPYRKSKKSDNQGPLLELSFVSPEVGRRHAELLDELSYRTSWRITVADRVDQQGVLAAFGELVPPTWTVVKGPGLDLAGRKVRLKLAVPPDAAELAAAQKALQEATGFTLEIL